MTSNETFDLIIDVTGCAPADKHEEALLKVCKQIESEATCTYSLEDDFARFVVGRSESIGMLEKASAIADRYFELTGTPVSVSLVCNLSRSPLPNAG